MPDEADRRLANRHGYRTQAICQRGNQGAETVAATWTLHAIWEEKIR